MFGKAYAVDVISDAGQHFDALVSSREVADKVFDLIAEGDMPNMPSLPESFTIRLICNGEVIRKDDVSSRRR